MLAPQLPDSFREMEPLFLAVICGCDAGLFRDALHEVYVPRIQRGDVYFAANFLGARGALLSVLAHFFEEGRWGLPAEMGLEGQTLSPEDQLFILMQAGLYLTTRGLGAPEARSCYESAESLCHSLNHPRLLCLALMGLCRYSLVNDKLTTTMQIAQRVYLLAQEQNDSALMIGAYRALAVTLYFLGDFGAAREYAMRGIRIWRSGSVQSHAEDFGTPVVGCLIYQARRELHFGEIASSHATMSEAISLAKELNDMYALALTVWHAGWLAYFERNLGEV
jgi:MalT-like TPR region